MGILETYPNFILRALEAFSKVDPIDYIYHYTTIESLESILSSKEIRFSDCRYLNDFREISYGVDIVKGLIDEKLKEVASLKKRKILLERRLLRLQEKMDASRFPNNYIFCLCENGNLLSQWRGYSRESCPVALKIKINKAGKQSKRVTTYLFKVIYDKKIQHKLVSAIIENHLKIKFKDSVQEFLHLSSVLWGLYIATIYFKDASFQEEKEWRYVYADYSPGRNDDNINFIKKKMFYLPYLNFKFSELFPNTKSNPIKEIIVGPQRNFLSLKSIEEYLRVKKIDIPVTHSQIPYRI